MASIYVGKLPEGTTSAELGELFSKYGVVEKVDVKPAGYGFISMDAEGTDKAIDALDGFEWNGAALQVERSQSKDKQGRPARAGYPARGGEKGGSEYAVNRTKCIIVENLNYETHWQVGCVG